MIIKVNPGLEINELKKKIKLIANKVVNKDKFQITTYYWTNKNLSPFFEGIPRHSKTYLYLKDLKNKEELEGLQKSEERIAFSVYIFCDNLLNDFLKIKVWSLSVLEKKASICSRNLEEKRTRYEIYFSYSDKNYFKDILKKIKKGLKNSKQWV